MKPPGIAGPAEPADFTATGPITGGFYAPEELPGSLALAFTFGHDTTPLATGAGTLDKKFVLGGTLIGGANYGLDCAFTPKTGLILGKRPKVAVTGPLSLTGVLLLEQSIVTGSAIFTDAKAGDTYTAPVTGTFPP